MSSIQRGELLVLSPPPNGSETATENVIALTDGPEPVPVYSETGNLYSADGQYIAETNDIFSGFVDTVVDKVRQSLGDSLIRDIESEIRGQIRDEFIEDLFDVMGDVMQDAVTYTLEEIIPEALKELASRLASTALDILTDPEVQQAVIEGIQNALGTFL